jgi:hypothetical protein
MPSYPLTFPTNIHPDNVRVNRRRAAAISTSPTTYKQQIYQHPGKRWEIDVTLQPMHKTEAALWTQFFYDLDGVVGTFNFNLNPHCPGLLPAPGVVVFRSAEPSNGWDSKLATTFSFSFRAVEDI